MFAGVLALLLIIFISVGCERLEKRVIALTKRVSELEKLLDIQ